MAAFMFWVATLEEMVAPHESGPARCAETAISFYHISRAGQIAPLFCGLVEKSCGSGQINSPLEGYYNPRREEIHSPLEGESKS